MALKMWPDCPVEETDERGRKTRTTEARDKRRAIPQGSPLSPLLANIYMRRFVLGWKKLGLERSLGTRLVTYADDLVILCRGSVEYLISDAQAGAVAEVIRETGIKPTADRSRAAAVVEQWVSNLFGPGDRPTIAELEALLQGPDREVVVLPNGEVAVGKRKEIGFGTE